MILQPYITQSCVITSNDYPAGIIGFEKYVLDLRDQQSFSSLQHFKNNFGFRPGPTATIFLCMLLYWLIKFHELVVIYKGNLT